MEVCPDCGAENPGRARFCLECGAAMAASSPRAVGERKPVSVGGDVERAGGHATLGATEATLVAPPTTWRGAARRASGVGQWLLRHEQYTSLALLALLAWTAQFGSFARLGLYEDDYLFIARVMGADPAYLADRLGVFTDWPQGRPLGFFLPDLFSFIGDKLGGLPGIYLVGFVIVVLNSYLCYRLLRFRTPPSVALVGAAVFLLFPADTTKILLTHDFQLQPGLTFLLLATIAYANQRPLLAYPLALGALLCYETAFLPFIGIPLLVLPWNRRLVRSMAWHLLAVVVILGVVVAVRLLMGEERVVASTSGIGGTLVRIAASMIIGPAWAVALFGYGPLKAVPTWDLAMVVTGVLIGAAAAWILRVFATTRKRRKAVERPFHAEMAVTDRAVWREIGQLAVAGGALLCLGYGLAFTHFPPLAVTGRGTSVHLGATLGASVLFASGYWALERLAARTRWPSLAPIVIGAYLALASGYSMAIARDFQQVWQTQRAFWHDVAACCSDLQEGTVLIYEWDGDVSGEFIFANSWADPLVLERVYRFPSEWSNPPRLFSLTSWHERVELDPAGNGLRWLVPEAAWDEHWAPLPQANVIVLRRENGRIVRLTEPIDVGGGRLQLKPIGSPTTDGFGHGPLWPYLAAPQ
jgi:hypothetical protein